MCGVQADDTEELASENGDGSGGGDLGDGGGDGNGDGKADGGGGAAQDGFAVDKNSGDDASFDGTAAAAAGSEAGGAAGQAAAQMMINMKVPPDHLDFATILPSLAELRGERHGPDSIRTADRPWHGQISISRFSILIRAELITKKL